VEGAEADVLEAAATNLHVIRRVHVGTHSHDVERRLRLLFGRLGWECSRDHAIGSTVDGVWFENGVQTWLNPHR
jgi:hypothetical protein